MKIYFHHVLRWRVMESANSKRLEITQREPITRTTHVFDVDLNPDDTIDYEPTRREKVADMTLITDVVIVGHREEKLRITLFGEIA
jgi:hypothetical protein